MGNFADGRRTFLIGMGALAASGLRASATAAKPSSMTLSTYGGDYGNIIKTSFEAPFTAETGIPMLADVGENPQRFAKMRIYRNRPRFDLINLQDRWLYQAAQENLLETLDYTKLPATVDIPTLYKKKTWLPYSLGYIGIIYNTQRVTSPPKTWNDVLNDKYKGRIFIDDFSHFGMHYTLAIAMANGGGYDNIMPGMNFVKEIKDRLQPRFITTSQEGMRLLANGEVDIAIWQKSRSLQLKQQGKPIEYVAPSTGDVAYSYGNGIVKASSNIDWAHVYMNQCATPQGQGVFCAAQFDRPTNTKAPIAPQFAAVDSDPSEATAIELDYDQILPRLDEWTKTWNRLIAT